MEYDPHNPRTDEPLPDELHAFVGADHIVITDTAGYEVVFWHEDEFRPKLMTTIANAVRLTYEDPQKLITLIWGPGEWPVQRKQFEEPTWPDLVDDLED